MEIENAKATLEVANADLSRSDFNDVNLQQATFTNVNLSRAMFMDINCSGAKFSNLNLPSTNVFPKNEAPGRADQNASITFLETHPWSWAGSTRTG